MRRRSQNMASHGEIARGAAISIIRPQTAGDFGAFHMISTAYAQSTGGAQQGDPTFSFSSSSACSC